MKVNQAGQQDDGGEDRGRSHVYGIAGFSLPDGEQPCAVCDETCLHGAIGGFDDDLTGYVCRDCLPALFRAESALVAAGMLRPTLDELWEIEDRG